MDDNGLLVNDFEKALIHNGGSILLMPEVKGRNLQIAKGITQIWLKIAISGGALLDI